MLTLYLAQSLDGFIAGPNDETPWSETEWKLFSKEVNQNDALIIGRKTFEIMIKGNEFNYINISYVFVLTHDPKNVEKLSKKLDSKFQIKPFNDKSNLPENLNYLIGGGAKAAEYFLEKGLVDQIVLDIEFLFLGEGIKVDWQKFNNLKLKYLKTLNYPPYGVQVRFEVE